MDREKLISWFKRAAAMDPGAPSMTIPMSYVHAAHQTLQLNLRETNASLIETNATLIKERDEAENAVAKILKERDEAKAGPAYQELLQLKRDKFELECRCTLLTNERDEANKEAKYQVREKKELKEALRISKMSVEEKCRELHIQDCHICPVLSCCDNTSPAGKEWDEMKAENASLQKRLDIAQKTYANLAEQCLMVQPAEGENLDMARMRHNVERVTAERDDMRRRLDEASKETEELRKQKRYMLQTDPFRYSFRKVAARLKEVTAERDELHGEAAVLRGDLSKRDAEIEQLRGEKNAALRGRNDARKDKGVLYSALQKQDAAVRAFGEQCMNCSHVNELREQRTYLETKCGERDAEIALLRTEGHSIVAERDDMRKLRDKLKEELRKVTECLTKLTGVSDIDTSVTALWKLKDERNWLRRQRNNAQKEAHKVRDYLLQANYDLKKVRIQRDNLREDASANDYLKLVDELRGEAAQLRSDLGKRDAEIGLLRTMDSPIEAERNMLKKEIFLVKDECDKWHEQRNAEIALLCTEGSSIVAERNKLRKQRNVAHAENDRLRKQLHRVNLATEGSSIVAERDALRQELEEASTKELRALKVLAAMHEAERDKLKGELDKTASEGLAVIALAEVYKKEIAGLKKELGETRDCLRESVDDIDDYGTPSVRKYMSALSKARHEKMDAQSSRDLKTIELIELKKEFLEVLKPFELYLPSVLSGDVKVAVDDVRKAQELYNKLNVDENGDPS